MLKPALVVMATLAVLAPSFGTETPGTKGIGGEPDIAGVAKKVYPSVVRVEARNGTRRVATGVVVEKGGYIVTTALMSPREEKITVTTSEGKKIEAEFLGFDTETQLALLKAKDAGLPALAAGKPADLAPGSWICVVGVSPEETAAVTQGIVSSVAADKIRLNVWVTPGSSGGPVVDANGRLVGLLRGIYMEERPVVFQFRDKAQAGSGVVLSNRAEAPVVRHGPGRPRRHRHGRRRPDQGQGQGRAGLDGRRHRRGPGRPDRDRHGRHGQPGRAGQAHARRRRPQDRRQGRARPRRAGRRDPQEEAGAGRHAEDRARRQAPWTSRSSSASWPKSTPSRRWTSASPAFSGRTPVPARQVGGSVKAPEGRAAPAVPTPFEWSCRDPQVHRRLLQRAQPRAGRALRGQGGDGPARLPTDRGRPRGEGQGQDRRRHHQGGRPAHRDRRTSSSTSCRPRRRGPRSSWRSCGTGRRRAWMSRSRRTRTAIPSNPRTFRASSNPGRDTPTPSAASCRSGRPKACPSSGRA
ncbi:MAG: trypsin-like peptidase domain-containing protein [Candidatus Moduliflexus flocculans]|nr:trypsin-like peptidase domain-containing protein [Candidatus Moduliflexus flocculans]